MTTTTAAEPTTLSDLIIENVGGIYDRWHGFQSSAIGEIVERYDDEPESIKDYGHSDWVNLDECYTRDLINRYDQQEYEIKQLFNDYCEAIGATSTLEALEGYTIDDPDDMKAAMVNLAMTHGARELLRMAYPEF